MGSMRFIRLTQNTHQNDPRAILRALTCSRPATCHNCQTYCKFTKTKNFPVVNDFTNYDSKMYM